MATFIYPQIQATLSGGATEATALLELAELEAINTNTSDAATESTLSALETKVPSGLQVISNRLAVDGSGVTQPISASSLPLPTGAASEATLSNADSTLTSLNSKVTTVDTDDVTISSSALPTGAATEATLSNAETALSNLDARVAGSLVPETHDYLALTYVASGNGVGEIETVTYKTGGSGGTTVATLTLAYDGSNRLTSVTRS